MIRNQRTREQRTKWTNTEEHKNLRSSVSLPLDIFSERPACTIAPKAGPMQGTSADDKETTIQSSRKGEHTNKRTTGQNQLLILRENNITRKARWQGTKITRGQEQRWTRRKRTEEQENKWSRGRIHEKKETREPSQVGGFSPALNIFSERTKGHADKKTG